MPCRFTLFLHGLARVPQRHSVEHNIFLPLQGQPRVPFSFLLTLQELLQSQRSTYNNVNKNQVFSNQFNANIFKTYAKIWRFLLTVYDITRPKQYGRLWKTERFTKHSEVFQRCAERCANGDTAPLINAYYQNR